LDDERRRVFPNLLVLRERHADVLRAARIAALADEIGCLGPEASRGVPDLLVDVAKERLGLRDPLACPRHPGTTRE
jgi:hypothetical protein